MLSSDAVVFGSNIAYLRQVKVGQVVQFNVTPLFPADMQLTVVSIAGRAISPIAPLSASIIREQVAVLNQGSSKACGERISFALVNVGDFGTVARDGRRSSHATRG